MMYIQVPLWEDEGEHVVGGLERRGGWLETDKEDLMLTISMYVGCDMNEN